MILSLGAAALVPIWAAYVLKLSENGFRHSVEQSTRELLYLPVPASIRLQAKAFIDVFVQRCSKGIAAVALLPVSLELVSQKHLSWAILVVAVAWLWITTVVRREYVWAFREGLKSGAVQEIPSIDMRDVTTLTTLVESLGSSDPRQVLHSIELLTAHGQHRLVPPILLHHDDARVRRKTLDVLTVARRTDAVQLIERTIGDDDPQVRTAAIHALSTLLGEDASELMADRLQDDDPRMRSAAVASLATGTDESLKNRAFTVLDNMLEDQDPAVRVEASKALAEIAEPEGCKELVQLLYDRHRAVVGSAIAAVRCRLERDGPNPLYIPILISLMGNRRLKHAAREAIVAYGERSIDALVHFMNAEEEQIWVRRAVPKTIALIGSPAAATGLLKSLGVKDGFLRRKIIEALSYLRARHPKIKFKTSTIAEQIQLEVRWYLRSFADLWAVSSLHQAHFEGPHAHWHSSARVPTLLQQVMAQRMTTAVASIFGLLELIYQQRDVGAAYRSLTAGDPRLRANALEYLDNTVTGSVRRDIFAVIDDAPPEEKINKAEQLFGISVESAEATLGRLLEADPQGDPASVHLAFAAIHGVYADKVEEHYPSVEELASSSEDPLLRETARWVLRRLRQRQRHTEGKDIEARSTVDYDEQGGGRDVSQMAQIEKVVFLQGVDLFGSCNAEQLLQLAAIAKEQRFDEGNRIYVKDEPADALYCVVEGSVLVTGSGEGPLSVERAETFGVVDILSGQLRTANASANAASNVLVIEAEDFFDLLSNNIEIVRALFRQLTRSTTDNPGGLL
jgi:AAA family ATP:ADP antiporter